MADVNLTRRMLGGQIAQIDSTDSENPNVLSFKTDRIIGGGRIDGIVVKDIETGRVLSVEDLQNFKKRGKLDKIYLEAPKLGPMLLEKRGNDYVVVEDKRFHEAFMSGVENTLEWTYRGVRKVTGIDTPEETLRWEQQVAIENRGEAQSPQFFGLGDPKGWGEPIGSLFVVVVFIYVVRITFEEIKNRKSKKH